MICKGRICVSGMEVRMIEVQNVSLMIKKQKYWKILIFHAKRGRFVALLEGMAAEKRC